MGEIQNHGIECTNLYLRKKLISILIICLLFLCSCSSRDYTITKLINKDNRVQLHQYDSPYTMLFENENSTYTAYIFSSPIQYKNESGFIPFNNELIEIKKENYVYTNKHSNTEIYFPNYIKDYILIKSNKIEIEIKYDGNFNKFNTVKKIAYINQFGTNVDAVVYKSNELELYFYTSNLGLELEVKYISVYKPLSFEIKSNINMLINNFHKYSYLEDEYKNSKFIIYPLFEKNNKNDNKVEVKQLNDFLYNVNFYFTSLNKNSTYSTSFNFVNENSPDSEINSCFSCKNSYLDKYSIIEKNNDTNNMLFCRLRLNYFFTCYSEDIISAYFNTYCMNYNKKKINIKLNRIKEQWSSTNLNKNNRIFA